ncbi:hypothetical protein SAMD00023353_3400270 [Rosellinia necatrix]|uniref:Uncharacterized protein n=1 Tax=Rosellinia necatrix TaxID=77044 RepID=A0A1S8A8W0_ROSNE|nr:hypothetical protein SAMD00023353_3400270 [Rosellinia necatrix]
MIPPAASMNKVLRSRWISVLSKDPYGLDVRASFFECDGNLITAVKLVSLVRVMQQIHQHNLRPYIGEAHGLFHTIALFELEDVG